MPETDLTFSNDTSAARFELLRGSERLSRADYSLDGDVVAIPHVETEWAHRGNGYAEHLMARVVESIRASGGRIRPMCPFAAQYLRQRPETHDLVAR